MLTGIHVLLTYTCNFECDHCFLYCSPRAEGTFTLEQIREVIEEAGKDPREIRLDDYPALRTLMETMRAVFAGDLAVLKRLYRIGLEDLALGGRADRAVGPDAYQVQTISSMTNLLNGIGTINPHIVMMMFSIGSYLGMFLSSYLLRFAKICFQFG